MEAGNNLAEDRGRLSFMEEAAQGSTWHLPGSTWECFPSQLSPHSSGKNPG